MNDLKVRILFACVLVLAGIGLTVGWEHTGRIQLGPFHVSGLGVKLNEAKLPSVKTVERIVYKERAAAAITAKVDAATTTAQERIRTVYRNKYVEVPKYVSDKVDDNFSVPVGLVRVLNAAALNKPVSEVPDPSGKPDDSASDFSPSDIGRFGVTNLGTCQVEFEKLRSLQLWVREQEASFNSQQADPKKSAF